MDARLVGLTRRAAVIGLAAGVLVASTAFVTIAGPAASTMVAANAPPTLAQAAYDRMTTAQRIGQLFMVGTPVGGLSSATVTAVSRYHVGNVILTGRTTTGAAPVRALASRADALTTTGATAGVPLFIATDQEGGAVQVLQGPGFSRMPAALTQGSWPDATLTASAATWALQLSRAGANVNLAPVMDTVPAALGTKNAPIGRYLREFGYTPGVVAAKGSAFLRGMRGAGVAMTAKHFPGLGLVTANTDTSSGVTDTATTRTSASVSPFRSAIGAGAQLMMISSADYSRIDPGRPAAFSPVVITGMVRTDLGFTGIVISDDLGQARQVQAWAPGARAVNFLAAGGDIVLTVDPAVIPAMVSAVTTRAAADPTFRAQVNAAALRVLTTKAADGLLAPRLATDGQLGPVTASALQRWLGLRQTGRLDATTIRALQARVATTADGRWGSQSMAALQTYLGISRDGAPTWNRRTVAALQAYLNTQL